MRVLGVDGSLNTGLIDVSFQRGETDLEKMDLHYRGVITAPVKKGMQRMERYSEIASKLIDVTDGVDYDGIFIEGYSFGSKTQLATMGEIGCVLRYFLWQTNPDRLMVEVPPTSLKKFITGSGNAPKDTIMQQVLKRWGFEAKNNDEADAYGLAMFGLLWMGASIDMPKKNLEAFNKVNKEFKAMRGE